MAKVGIIGGSGLDDPDMLKEFSEIESETPFGNPTSKLKIGKINNVDIVLIARHGRKHEIMPSNVNYRANIWALKEQGCTHVLASTACGSLREEIEPGHLVFPDQFIDRTTKRHTTFYDKDKVCHIPMAEPFCPKIRELLAQTADSLSLVYHKNKTLITIEGPRFSTKAESKMFRAWGADIINMSVVTEAILAREAGLCYHPVAMSTDYDCFMEDKPSVTWEEVSRVMKQNADNVKKLLIEILPKLKDEPCDCREAIKSAIMTK